MLSSPSYISRVKCWSAAMLSSHFLFDFFRSIPGVTEDERWPWMRSWGWEPTHVEVRALAFLPVNGANMSAVCRLSTNNTFAKVSHMNRTNAQKWTRWRKSQGKNIDETLRFLNQAGLWFVIDCKALTLRTGFEICLLTHAEKVYCTRVWMIWNHVKVTYTAVDRENLTCFCYILDFCSLLLPDVRHAQASESSSRSMEGTGRWSPVWTGTWDRTCFNWETLWHIVWQSDILASTPFRLRRARRRHDHVWPNINQWFVLQASAAKFNVDREVHRPWRSWEWVPAGGRKLKWWNHWWKGGIIPLGWWKTVESL